jgi:hypothetical protein
MHIIYTADAGWQLHEKLDAEDFYVGHAADTPFPHGVFHDLDDLILVQDACKIWLGGAQYRTRANSIPYYLNKYIPDYPRQISARQLLLARHLNTHFLTMPRFRIGMTCTTPACVEISHMIPYAYYPRTKKGKIDEQATSVVKIETPEMSEEQKKAIRRRVLKAIETPDPTNVTSLLPTSGRTADQFTPEENAEIERAQRKLANEEPATLDTIGTPTTRTHK